ncbi:hypothetical protein D3C78_1128970 [compost metagenome]
MPGSRRHPIFQGACLIDGARENLVTRAFFYRQTLTGNRRLVDARLATDHLAIQAYAFTWAHPHQSAEHHLLNFNLTPLAIGLSYGGHIRRELHQPTDGVARTVQRACLDQLGDGKQEHDHGRFWPLPDQHRARHRDAHQRVDVEVAVLQGNPALLVGTQTTTEDRHQGDQCHDPGGPQRGEVNDFGANGRNPRQCQWPPMFFFRCRRVSRFLAGISQGFGLHAQRSHRLFDRRGVVMGMANLEHAIDQVELELLDPRQLAQLVLDKGLFGRAIHRLDAEATQARIIAGSITELH